MWKRRDLKKKAKQVVKKNYWTAIVICFLIALLTGEFGMSIVGLWEKNDPLDPNLIIHSQNDTNQEESQEQNAIIEANETTSSENTNKRLLSEEQLKGTLSNTERTIFEAIEANLNSATKSQKYIFKIWDAVNSFNLNETELGVTLIIGAVLAYAFTMFIADPLIVGGKKYFLKARKDSKTKVGVILDVFKDGNLINIAIIMFLRNIYNALWYLTIIGGVIKTYEYRMIPYILAENPKIKRKEAFRLSKEMMKGNKWRTFILDMSFFGWNFLSVMTFGLLSILYVNPYNAATIAELYVTLKDEKTK